ncbi:MAG: hypothetical protein IKM20_04685 [Erysipelotrichales bacterium]|nr:hypothetical protein [Erysipelotrichales bacterium]
MKRKFKYVIFITILISIIIFKLFTATTYQSYTAEIDEIIASSDVTTTMEANEIRVNYNGESSYSFVIYGDSKYEGKAYIPLAIQISEELQADVRIIEYNFLGNMNVLLHAPSDEVVIAHGDGSEYLGCVSNKADAIILLGSTSFTKLKNDNVMMIKCELDMVSEVIKNTLPTNTLYYKIEKGNFSNYVYASLHEKDASALVTREEQLNLCVEYIEDFISSLDL